MFECDGIPCRHMLAYFNHLFMEDLPNEYILLRWKKSAKAGRVRNYLGTGSKEICDISSLERRFKFFQLASNVIDEAIVTEDDMRFVEEVLRSDQNKQCDMKKGDEVGEGSSIQVSGVRDHGFKEPLQVQAKGCGKRLKGGKEKAVKKARCCHGCGLTGQSSSQSCRLNDEDDEDDLIDCSSDD
ncbi:hypothetical protein Dimus_011487 [Dionaea muscipula]